MKKLVSDNLGLRVFPIRLYESMGFDCPDLPSGFRILHPVFFIPSVGPRAEHLATKISISKGAFL